ncbi:MAG: glycosyltransferase family 2 protein [Spirochaetaceae bacterium]|jgi:glycosyltransferase involved in cell wall biosynthesis|nr:glycosyltransferase family 2 protein [Spirochaetaceae bacterium]
MRYAFVIPVYNHGAALLPLLKKLSSLSIPIIIVDDGSCAETKAYLAEAASLESLSIIVTLPKNTGKGGAVCAGIRKAHAMNVTHIFQIDADGQHDAGRTPFFLEQSRRCPDAAVCGFPEYDSSVPASRKKGRVIANTWARIVTLSPSIPDVMCGFRIYPVESAMRIIERCRLDMRMGFDIDILVRMYWDNTPLMFFPVAVKYPKDGVSHFHIVWDNVRISLVFTKLFFGMLLRMPRLIRRMHGGIS